MNQPKFLAWLAALTCLAHGTFALAQTNPRVPTAPQLGLRAWHKHGQTWLVWSNTYALAAGETYDVYASATPAGALTGMRLIGRVLQEDFAAQRLRDHTAAPQWNIPTPSNNLYRLRATEALFVYTPHVAMPEYFGVVKHGESVLGPGNLTPAIAQPMTEPVTCHPQSAGITATTRQSYTDYAFWLDGRADWTNSRPDIPVLGNASFNGVASLFRVYQPTVSQPPGAKLPLVLFGHPMNRNWAEWVPGEPMAANLSLVLTNGLMVTLDDGVWFLNKNRNQVDQAFTFWFGYWEGFDRLAASETDYPPDGALIVDYTVRRNVWLLDWLIANQSADSNRVAWIGSSMGSGGGAMDVRAHPERFSAATFFVAMVHDPSLVAYTGAQFGTPTQNLPTTLGFGIEDMFFPTNSPAPDKLPPMRYVWGVNDTNVDWNSDALGQKTNVIPTLAASRLGFITYWDERGHEPQSWAGHWAGPNISANDGSTILTAQFMTRYRNDQSFPAFSNDSHPDTNVLLAVPFCGTCTNWGTRNGYFDWDVTSVTDTATNWAVTLWMHSTNTTVFSNDVPAFASALTDVTIRRPQRFKPAAGAMLDWKLSRVDNGAVLQSGQVTVAADGLVGVPALTILRDPQRTRLEIAGAPVAPLNKTVVVTVNADGSFTPARVDIFSGDTVEWRFTNRTDTIIPVNLNASGQPDCSSYRPYDPIDPNEFTGPMPRAVSGLFTISPEEMPYASQEATWRSTNLVGVFIRPRWDDVHLGPDQFNWAPIDQEIDKAVKNGKVYSIGFKAGVKGTPQWIFDPAKTVAVVPRLDFGFKQAGQPVYYGSPADANYRKHYFDLLKAAAAHLRERNAWYRALAYIKPSGANLYTHENRLPNDTTQDLATWAGPGRYTPTALYEFYQLQTALLAAEFPQKEMGYALIQDGFPKINDFGEYEGQTPPLQHPLPKGTEQTETILNQGRTNYGTRFVVAHNGLQRKPAFCPGTGVHPSIVDPNFSYVGSGCPNRWVLEQSALGQVTGFQTTNDLLTDSDVDSALQNAWDNSDGIYVELYERNALQAESAVLPSGNTLGQWGERFHERRRTNFPNISDPFPLAYRHTFTRTASGGGPQLLYYMDPAKCSGTAATTYGVVAILPDLSFTSIVRNPNGTVQLTLAVSRAGTLRVEYSDDLAVWKSLQTFTTAGGTLQLPDTAVSSTTRFYRAILQ